MPHKKSTFEDILETEIKLDDFDNEMLAQLYIDPKYKSLLKLIDSLLLDLQNRGFREADRLEEFLAIKWTRAFTQLLKNTVQSQYNQLTNSKYGKKGKMHTEDFENTKIRPIESSEEQIK